MSKRSKAVIPAPHSFERTFALYQVCVDYHSGQSSRGYRLLSSLKRRLLRSGIDPDMIDTRSLSHKCTYKHFERQWARL